MKVLVRFLLLAPWVFFALVSKTVFAQSEAPVSKIADIQFPAISELSGIARSATYDDVYWVHNDSGDAPRLFALDNQWQVIYPSFLSGQYHGEEVENNKEPWPGLSVELAANIDWEDITIADDTIYIADMGNNGNARRDLGVYVLTEPNPRATFRARPLQFIPVRYPDQSSYPPEQWRFDSEAIFAFEGALYFLTKHRGESIYQLAAGTNLYRLQNWRTDQINVLEKVDSRDDAFFITAADLSPDKEWLAITGYTELWLFPQPVEDGKWLSGEARRIPLDARVTGVIEALTWKDRSTLIIGNERGALFEVRVDDIPVFDGTANWEEGRAGFRRLFPIYR